ncbi:TPA_asm: N [Leucadendron betacytorhabdovirus 1]|nr:TPA_asm: N [Leucadendron betacytorhabdovirus 1]
MSGSHKNSYEGVPEDTTLSLTTSKIWKDDVFDDMVVYTIESRTEKDIMDIFVGLKAEMTTKAIGKFSHHKVITLAAHLGVPNSDKYKKLLHRFPLGDEIMPLGMTFTQTSPPATRATPVLPDPQEPGISEEEKEKRTKAREDANRTPFPTSAHDEEDVFGEGQTGQHRDIDVKYATFIAALLTKLVTKTPENLINSWKAAHERFRGFYMETQDSPVPAPNSDWLKGLKEFLNHDKKGIRTLLKVVYELETTYPDPDSNEAGICRFLFSLPLSYTGMHAYKLFLAVRQASGKTNKFLLNALLHPKNVSALDEIANILTHHESRESLPRTSKFRYARLIGPQYFLHLQTKNCKALVYCLVSVLGHYTMGENNNFKPDQIFGIQNIPAGIKAQMTEAARLIAESVSKEEKPLYSPYMMAAAKEVAKAPKETLQVGLTQGQEEDDIFNQ